MQILQRFHKKYCSFRKIEVKVSFEGVRERGNPNVNWHPTECLGLSEECAESMCRFTKRPGANKNYLR